ncbi:prolipoprotein diacylglyceryl transferase [Mycobacterium ulcerans subsp. shinshuense]|uniref:Phosphatidylglycerol--prolipoprotein diacylglyceryl transferase n=1 Tax=Mycobacterium ulcerans subsp. shinshuense TaxID=1124626 RepID=A0A1B4Y462_MYCUL|nr:prolipoprotein diacylglyceryl transferase [Mycobacterium ulcerans]BAV41849.1 prolipoprotein diacylglyceryl transferase [Mycobacterium ulcerans subsp. shinshuense]
MTATVLAYFPSPPRGVWHLGPLPIRAYAFFIIIGIVMGLMIGDRRFAARGGERGVIYDIALWMVPFGLIGGRLYHLSTDWQTYFGEGGAGLGAALRIWDGGLGIWGAVTLGTVGAWIGCRRRGIPLPAFLDAVAPGVVMGQAIGRLGNYFNQELYGRETTVPWGLEIFYRRDPSGFVDVHSLDGVSTGQVAVVVQPTFLYELIWNLLVFAALIYLDRRFTIGHGRLFASYVALYCVGRFCVELLRDDTATHIAGIRINSFTSTFVFIGAVVYIILAPKGREDPASVRGTAAAADEVPEPEPAGEVATAAAPADDTEGDEPTGLAETAKAAEVAEPETVGSAVAGDESTADTEASDAVEGEVGEAAEAEAPEAEVGEVEVAEAVEGEVEAAAEAEEAEVGEVEAVDEAAEAEAPEVGEIEAAEAVEGEVEVAAEAEEAEAGEDEPKEAEEVAEAEGSEAEDKTAQAIDGGQTGVDEAGEADAEPDDDSTAAEPEVVVEQADIEEIEPQEPEAEAVAAAEATDADEGDGEPAEPASDDLDAVAAEDADVDATATEAEESGDESPEPAADSEEPEADESAPEDSAEDTSSGESDTQSELEQSQTIEQGSDQTSAGDGEGPPPGAAVDGDTGPTRQGWRGRLRNRMRRSGR